MASQRALDRLGHRPRGARAWRRACLHLSGEAFHKRVVPLAESVNSKIVVDADVTDTKSLDGCSRP